MDRYRALIITFAVLTFANVMDIVSSLLNNWYTPGVAEANPFAQTAAHLFDATKGIEIKLIYTAVFLALSLIIMFGLKPHFGPKIASLLASIPVWFMIYSLTEVVICNFLFLMRFDKVWHL